MDFYDCAIVGGGPAGAALAWLLAGQGWRILLVDDGRHRAAAPRETLFAAARAGLERSGLWRLAEAAAEVDSFRHGAIWGSREVTFREDGEAGLLLSRGTFDAALRRAAATRGAEVVEGGRVGRLPEAGKELDLVLATGEARRVRCSRIVLATGRRPRPELLPLQEVARGPETAALTVVGHNPAASRSAVVEAVPQGWWWWIGDAAAGGAATLLCDAEELAAIGSKRLVAAARLAAVGPVTGLTGARLVHGTRATARVLQTPGDVLLLGDAAATIDPLASQGVEKAFAAADHAAAVLRTAREHPEWWERLRNQHARWERGLFAAHASMAQAFLRRENRFRGEPFWRLRLAGDTAITAPAIAPVGPLCISPEVAEAPVLQRQDDRFVEVEGARHTGSGDTMSHIGFVPVVPVLRTFALPRNLEDAVAAAGRDPRLFVLPPRAVRAASLILHQYGWLISTPLAPGTR